MKKSTTHLKSLIPCATSLIVAMCSIFVISDAYSASVSGRTAPARAKVSATTARVPTTKTTASSSSANTTVAEPEIPKPKQVEEIVEETFEFENRTSMFDDAIGASGTSVSGTTSDSDLADMIRKQRNALNAADATTATQDAVRTSVATGQNACDTGLRQCMQSKCGADFTKCSGDTDTAWGDKMDLCRIKVKCSGHEYQLFTTEIKADRDANAELANFNKIIDCGNRYNTCIINECGTTFSKCLGKSAGDAAIAKCKKIQTECTQMDNGLASRMMNVFATLRQDAEKQIQRDEQHLYDLRDEMESTCRRLGAMFDQRSLDCVYTINFFADNNPTPYASKKSYAGGTFDCEPGWFGIDITTFKENAYRETISQKSASAAMLGSGVGMAAGAVTSGAISRALDTQKAKKALEEAENGDEPTDKKSEEQAERDAKKEARQEKKDAKKEKQADKKSEKQTERDAKKEARQEKKDTKETDQDKKKEQKEQETTATKAMCDAVGGEWRASTKRCRCTDSAGKTITTKDISDCTVDTSEEEIEDEDDINTTQIVCEDKGGTWSNDQCSCKNAKGRDIKTTNPVSDCVEPSDDSDDDSETESESDESDSYTTNIKTEKIFNSAICDFTTTADSAAASLHSFQLTISLEEPTLLNNSQVEIITGSINAQTYVTKFNKEQCEKYLKNRP